MDDDAELAAIRARKLKELMGADPEPEPADGAEDAAEAAPDHPIDLSERELMPFVQKHGNVVIDCWAPWCGPCRMVAPVVAELAREMKGRVVFGKLNTDENQAAARAFGIQSIPTLLFFRAGKLVDRVVGALPKPQLAAAVRQVFRVRPT